MFAVGTEDMDALTFGSNVLLRHLTFSEARYLGACCHCCLCFVLLALFCVVIFVLCCCLWASREWLLLAFGCLVFDCEVGL